MAVRSSIPTGPLRVGLGVLILGFVVTAQRRIPLPEWPSGGKDTFYHTRIGMFGVGGSLELLLGGTNVGVQLIAYLRSFNLSHGLFVGVVALVFGIHWDPRCRDWSVWGLSESRCAVRVCRRDSPAVLGVTVGKHPGLSPVSALADSSFWDFSLP